MAGWVLQSQFQPFRSQDIWLIKVDEDGCLEPGCLVTGIEEQVVGLQEVLSVFPNPLASSQHATIRFEEQLGAKMPYASKETTISLFSLEGKEVYIQSVPKRGSNASFDLTLNLPVLMSGQYILHWTGDNKWFDSATIVVE